MDRIEDSLKDLTAALATDRLEMHYQPQVTSDGSSIAGVESLVRWRHPKAGWIPPWKLVAYAEAEGLIEALGEWSLRRACEDARRWPGLSVAINVSPLQFRNPNLVRNITGAAGSLGIGPERLELEITETSVFDDPERSEATMRQLRECGFRLALDDFGVGYSSLSYLRRMPWDKVKIDKSFVDDIAFATSAAIVHAVVALARAIGLKVTAEGVETREQHRFLRVAGCHYLQGYRFSRPLPADQLTELLDSWSSRIARLGGLSMALEAETLN